ncbi:MAG: hypothetical protein JNM85_09810 [Chthonomonas sp.]|nr:hypothetical protein [Chthonomonas sp.]
MSTSDRIVIEHAHVVHPLRNPPASGGWLAHHNDRILDWLANHVLASMIMFDIALIVPLLAIPMSDSVKITLGVISGSWIQWWALPALQRSQVKADQSRQAKADADHVALTHIANTVDLILARLDAKGI